ALGEEAVVDQPLVVATRPAMQDGPFRWRHGMKLTRMLERRSTSLNGYDRNDHNRRSRARSPASRSLCSRSRSRAARSRSHLALSRSAASRAALSLRAAYASTADCRTRVDATPAASVTPAKYEWMSSMFFCSAVLAAWRVPRSAPSPHSPVTMPRYSSCALYISTSALASLPAFSAVSANRLPSPPARRDALTPASLSCVIFPARCSWSTGAPRSFA